MHIFSLDKWINTKRFLFFFLCGDHRLQARNFMRLMKEGQLAFFYHSNCKEPGIAGIIKVSHCWEYCATDRWDIHSQSSSRSLDCEGSLRGPHSVWQQRHPLWRNQQGRQPQVEHGEVTEVAANQCMRDVRPSRSRLFPPASGGCAVSTNDEAFSFPVWAETVPPPAPSRGGATEGHGSFYKGPALRATLDHR